MEKLPAKIEAMRKGLGLLAAHPNVGEIRQRGLLAGIELVKDRATRESFPFEARTGHRVILEDRLGRELEQRRIRATRVAAGGVEGGVIRG